VTTSNSTLSPLRFGVFEFDPRAGELRKKGMKIKLQGQPVEILAMLLQHPGEPVTREELQKKLWPADTFVDFEQGLNNAIKRLRAALNDDSDNPRFIETLPRKGYRFVGQLEGPAMAPPPVEPAPSNEPQPKHQPTQRLLIFGTLGLLVITVGLAALYLRPRLDRFASQASPRIQALAVLPLANLSGDPEQEYFAEGMTEELTADLSKISAVRVISRTSAMRYKSTAKSLPEIARDLNVDGIVEGTVERAGNKVRITATLIHAATDTHIWAESYERDLQDVLFLQAEVAREIASQIRVTVTPQEQAQLSGTQPVLPEAYENYLKGRFYFGKFTNEGFRQCLSYFQQAVKVDPNYALGYVGQAECFKYLGIWDVISPHESSSQAKAAIQKALEIDNNLGEAHATLAYLHFLYDWDWSGAQSEFNRALELSPGSSDVHLWYAQYLSAMGKEDEAIREIEKAHSLDPVALLTETMVGRVYMLAHRFDKGIEQFQKTLALYPDSAINHWDLGICYESKGLNRKAVDEYLKSDEIDGLSQEQLAMKQRAFTRAGFRGYLQEELKSELDHPEPYYDRSFNLARLYALLGDKEKAFSNLDKAYEEGWSDVAFLKVDPELDTLRSDPRFNRLLDRVGLKP